MYFGVVWLRWPIHVLILPRISSNAFGVCVTRPCVFPVLHICLKTGLHTSNYTDNMFCKPGTKPLSQPPGQINAALEVVGMV